MHIENLLYASLRPRLDQAAFAALIIRESQLIIICILATLPPFRLPLPGRIYGNLITRIELVGSRCFALPLPFRGFRYGFVFGGCRRFIVARRSSSGVEVFVRGFVVLIACVSDAYEIVICGHGGCAVVVGTTVEFTPRSMTLWLR